MGGPVIEFGRPEYKVKISEAAVPGPLLQLTARVPPKGKIN